MTSEDNLRARLYDELRDQRAGLLGIRDSGQHMQPMTHYLDEDGKTLWFITSKQTDLVGAIGSGAEAEFTVIDADKTMWGSVTGRIAQADDEAKLDEIWSVVAAAWFDDGRRDPDVCLLGLSMAEAAVWVTNGNAAVFSTQIAKANMSREAKPDIGDHEVFAI